jgi:hypothetical protein
MATASSLRKIDDDKRLSVRELPDSALLTDAGISS